MTTNCIRQPHAVWSRCPCPDCKARNARLRKGKAAGTWETIPAETVYEALDRLLEVVSPTDVAVACGLSGDVIASALRKRRSRFNHYVAASIVKMARDLDHVQPRRVPAIGPSRRLQALARMGWTLRSIADRMGEPSTRLLWNIRAYRMHTVKTDLAASIARVYDELWSQQAPGKWGARTRNMAVRMGWAAPLAWDDDEIDDPDAEPWTEQSEWRTCLRCEGKGCWGCKGVGRRLYPSLAAADIDDIAWLAESGGTFETIGPRVGLSAKSVTTRLSRAGRVDLLVRIARNGYVNYNSENAIARYEEQQHRTS